jgi:hypothetical protein
MKPVSTGISGTDAIAAGTKIGDARFTQPPSGIASSKDAFTPPSEVAPANAFEVKEK